MSTRTLSQDDLARVDASMGTMTTATLNESELWRSRWSSRFQAFAHQYSSSSRDSFPSCRAPDGWRSDQSGQHLAPSFYPLVNPITLECVPANSACHAGTCHAHSKQHAPTNVVFIPSKEAQQRQPCVATHESHAMVEHGSYLCAIGAGFT